VHEEPAESVAQLLGRLRPASPAAALALRFGQRLLDQVRRRLLDPEVGGQRALGDQVQVAAETLDDADQRLAIVPVYWLPARGGSDDEFACGGFRNSGLLRPVAFTIS